MISKKISAVCFNINSKNRWKQIKTLLKNYTSFKEMNLEIQKFIDLDLFRYPAFLALSYALQLSYIKNINLLNKEICFNVNWKYPEWNNKYLQGGMTSERYKQEKELPIDDTFMWNDYIILNYENK